MLKAELLNLVKPGITYVIVPKRVPDMEEGWDDGMDCMVGIPLRVQEKTPYAVILASPKTGATYSFGRRYVEFFSKKKRTLKVIVNNKKFELDLVAKGVLMSVLREEDFIALQKSKKVDLSSNDLQMQQGAVEEIQEKCPRFFGALLSNNLMRRVY